MTAALTSPASTHDSVFKPAAVLMCGRMLAFAATFYIPVVLVRVFDPAQFGTYKQLFLIYLTVYYVGQVGMSSSLYYFIPLSPRDAGRYIANSVLVLGGAGVCGCILLTAGAPGIGRWMNNPELSPYLGWIGVHLFLMLIASPMESVLISRHRHLAAAASYALSDIGRAGALILPALLFHSLDSLVKGTVILSGVRVGAMVFYLYREYPGALRPDRSLLLKQLAYAVPFGAAVLVETAQGNLPVYVVSALTDPATFAIFAVGCLQIPLVDFAASPTSDVMMVQMQERRAQGRNDSVLAIWHDTTCKLSLFFLPLTALMMTLAPEIIVALFTRKYLASIPIFVAWTLLIPLSALQVDGVLRVFAETRFILLLNLARLAITAGLLKWSLRHYGLLGPALTIVLAMAVFKVAALIRLRTLLQARASDLLPWRRLAGLAGAAFATAAFTWVLKPHLSLTGLSLIVVSSVVYAGVFSALVRLFGLLSSDEVRAIEGLLSRFRKREVCA